MKSFVYKYNMNDEDHIVTLTELDIQQMMEAIQSNELAKLPLEDGYVPYPITFDGKRGIGRKVAFIPTSYALDICAEASIIFELLTDNGLEHADIELLKTWEDEINSRHNTLTDSFREPTSQTSEPTMLTINHGDPCPYCGGHINEFIKHPTISGDTGKCSSCDKWVKFDSINNSSKLLYVKLGEPCPICNRKIVDGICQSCGKKFGINRGETDNYILKLDNKEPSSSSGCFIATAVYGSYDAYEVLALRRWRDSSLSNTNIGQRFIKLYYKVSPSIALWIEGKSLISMFTKKLLDVFINIWLRNYR